MIHRPIEGTPKTCTLKRDGDQWFVSIVCLVEVEAPQPKTEPVVAIDRGVTNVIADSDGLLLKSPRFYGKAMKRLARAQQTVSRRKKGSKNREKAKSRVANLHRKVRRQREHFCHQLSHDYAKSHGTVVIEDLKIGNMVKANRGLARGILDQGWGLLAQFLAYKLAWQGGVLGRSTLPTPLRRARLVGVWTLFPARERSFFASTVVTWNMPTSMPRKC